MYSANAFNAAISRFPAPWELHRDAQPSNELVLYMRRWEDEIRSDAKDRRLRWTPQQRDVMMAACIEFRVEHNPDKVWREAAAKEALAVWKKGLQADSQSRHPRWKPSQRRENEKLIAEHEKNIAAATAARKKKKDDEWEARYGGFGGKIKLLGQFLAFFFILFTVKSMIRSMMMPKDQEDWIVLAVKGELQRRACTRIAVKVSPLSAVYSDGYYETPSGACGLRDEDS